MIMLLPRFLQIHLCTCLSLVLHLLLLTLHLCPIIYLLSCTHLKYLISVLFHMNLLPLRYLLFLIELCMLLCFALYPLLHTNLWAIMHLIITQLLLLLMHMSLPHLQFSTFNFRIAMDESASHTVWLYAGIDINFCTRRHEFVWVSSVFVLSRCLIIKWVLVFVSWVKPSVVACANRHVVSDNRTIMTS